MFRHDGTIAMRAALVRSTGGPEVITVEELPDPTPGRGEVGVDVAAGGVNFVDTYQRRGRYRLDTPFIVGSEGAGTVSAVGGDVRDLKVGDRVVWAGVNGTGYTTRAVVPAERLVKVPEGLDLGTAAAALLQGMTAHYLTHSTYPVSAGESVLVHAAAGGTGLLLTRLASLSGARVIGTVSTKEKEALAREAGAAEVIRRDETDDLPAAVRALTDGEGVAVAYDGVGAATFEASLASIRVRGMLVLFGAASGPVPPFDPQRLNTAGSLYLTRPMLAHYTRTRAELLEHAEPVLELVAAGKLPIHVGRRFPLDEAAEAHRALESGKTTGKLLIIP
jgi:NADPH2:quinone reductase